MTSPGPPPCPAARTSAGCRAARPRRRCRCRAAPRRPRACACRRPRPPRPRRPAAAPRPARPGASARGCSASPWPRRIGAPPPAASAPRRTGQRSPPAAIVTAAHASMRTRRVWGWPDALRRRGRGALAPSPRPSAGRTAQAQAAARFHAPHPPSAAGALLSQERAGKGQAPGERGECMGDGGLGSPPPQPLSFGRLQTHPHHTAQLLASCKQVLTWQGKGSCEKQRLGTGLVECKIGLGLPSLPMSRAHLAHHTCTHLRSHTSHLFHTPSSHVLAY